MRHGFSLVELSIVLVILGLLAGGVLTGQSLIRAAELRSVTTEIGKYQAAVNTFRDKYFSIPGDMSNATNFWGENATMCDTAAANGTPGTCNGNGNGYIATAAAAASTGEMFQFWNHLALAGLVEGAYTGVSVANTQDCTLGTNCPRARMNNGGWTVYGLSTPTVPTYGDGSFYLLDYGNVFYIGAAVAGSTPYGALLKPEEAWNIDTKMDDGKPASGSVIAIHWNNLCAAADDGTHANNDYASSYKLTDTSPRCSLIFRKAF